ncbi:MAG TPA: cytochrome P450, partial [Solirubrobacterales bacterium]|nr:cytochrome P450 [Solirubrobacterales bacterium]
AAHEDTIRQIVRDVLDRLEGRESCDLVTDVAQPAVARVIGSFMGIPEEDDAIWAELMNSALAASDPDYSPDGVENIEETIQKTMAEVFARCSKMIAERRENPTDDLTSVLVHAEVEGQMLEEHEIVMGFFLLVAAGNDSTKATYASGMRALLENPEQLALVRDDPSLVPGVVEEALRMFPAFAHFRRTATRDTVLNGKEIKQGEKVVMWYASSNRDETRYENPDSFDVLRNPEHQAFGAGGRHFCLGTALARLELRILLEETLARYPDISLAGKPAFVESAFLNQLKTLPVKLSA